MKYLTFILTALSTSNSLAFVSQNPTFVPRTALNAKPDVTPEIEAAIADVRNAAAAFGEETAGFANRESDAYILLHVLRRIRRYERVDCSCINRHHGYYVNLLLLQCGENVLKSCHRATYLFLHFLYATREVYVDFVMNRTSLDPTNPVLMHIYGFS